MSFVENIIGTIKNPKNAMNRIAERPMIEDALMLVGIYAILSAFNALIMSDKITYVYEGLDMPSNMGSIITIAGVVGALIMVFVIWVIGTAIIHFISLALGGEGEYYPQMMTIIGFSMIPLIFGGIIGLILLSMVEPMTITINMENPQVTKDLFDNTYLNISRFSGLLMQIWAIGILFFGVQSSHNLSSGKSAIVAGIPLLIVVISFAWGNSLL